MSRTCTRDAAGQAGRGAAIPSKIHTLSSSGMRCVATARMRARLVVTQCGRPGDLAFTLMDDRVNEPIFFAYIYEGGKKDGRDAP